MKDLIQRYIDAQDPYDPQVLRDLRGPGWHADWPQTGERISDHDADVQVNLNFPGYPVHEVQQVMGQGDDLVILPTSFPGLAPRPVRISEGGDTWFVEIKLTYPDGVWFAVVVAETLGERNRVRDRVVLPGGQSS